MKITRSQIEKTLRPGDVILVHYNKGGVVAAGIQFASGGLASHALCCVGGIEMVEADIGGVMNTLLTNYLTGKCRLTVKRLRPPMTEQESQAVVAFWKSRISDPYDMGMIVHVAFTMPIRRFLIPICPPIGRVLLRIIHHFSVASAEFSTCAELAARGLREARPKFMAKYDQEDITPEVLLRNARGLETVVVWESPVLLGG